MIEIKDREGTRYLTKSGISVLPHEEAAKQILEHGELPSHFKVEGNSETRSYETVYGVDISFNEFSDELEYLNTSHNQDHMDSLLDILGNSPRWQDEFFQRVKDELEFYDRTNNVKFLLALHTLVLKFKEDNVVWGVGRGSSVASLVLYLLEVHDINPLLYGIPFHELSKEL